jgi:hypothetical protein
MENKSQEDREDLNAFKERCDEPLIPLEEVVNGLSNKDICKHDNLSYGRINKFFIIDCSDCGKKLRIDNYETQLKILSEFKLSCECGKQTIIEQINKETCKWSSENKRECDFFHSYRVCISCDHTKEFTVQHGSEIDYRYCPYCGKEIEEIKE